MAAPAARQCGTARHVRRPQRWPDPLAKVAPSHSRMRGSWTQAAFLPLIARASSPHLQVCPASKASWAKSRPAVCASILASTAVRWAAVMINQINPAFGQNHPTHSRMGRLQKGLFCSGLKLGRDEVANCPCRNEVFSNFFVSWHKLSAHDTE